MSESFNYALKQTYENARYSVGENISRGWVGKEVQLPALGSYSDQTSVVQSAYQKLSDLGVQPRILFIPPGNRQTWCNATGEPLRAPALTYAFGGNSSWRLAVTEGGSQGSLLLKKERVRLGPDFRSISAAGYIALHWLHPEDRPDYGNTATQIGSPLMIGRRVHPGISWMYGSGVKDRPIETLHGSYICIGKPLDTLRYTLFGGYSMCATFTPA